MGGGEVRVVQGWSSSMCKWYAHSFFCLLRFAYIT